MADHEAAPRGWYADRVRRWLDRLLLLAVCVPFVHCIWRRTVVTRPAVTVLVIDAAGAPVSGAKVVVYWWSYPHHQLHEHYVATAGPDGQAAFTGASKRETIAPLCIHGVPQHEHTVCASAAGKGHGGAELERSGQTVTIRLAEGGATGDCARFTSRDVQR